MYLNYTGILKYVPEYFGMNVHSSGQKITIRGPECWHLIISMFLTLPFIYNLNKPKFFVNCRPCAKLLISYYLRLSFLHKVTDFGTICEGLKRTW